MELSHEQHSKCVAERAETIHWMATIDRNLAQNNKLIYHKNAARFDVFVICKMILQKPD